MQAGAQQGAPPGIDGKANGLPPVPPPPPSAFRDSPALGLGRSVWALHAWWADRGVEWLSLGVSRTHCFAHNVHSTV